MNIENEYSRLRIENDRLRAALEAIVNNGPEKPLSYVKAIARDALKK